MVIAPVYFSRFLSRYWSNGITCTHRTSAALKACDRDSFAEESSPVFNMTILVDVRGDVTFCGPHSATPTSSTAFTTTSSRAARSSSVSDDTTNTSVVLFRGVFILIPAEGTSSCLGDTSSFKTAFPLSFLVARLGFTGVDLTSEVQGPFPAGASFSLTVFASGLASRVGRPLDAATILSVLLSSSSINLMAFIFDLAREFGDCNSRGAALRQRSFATAVSSTLLLFFWP